jgi:hypothetical protein
MGASVFMCGKAFSQVPSYVPSSGLVGWWPFNGNANDESGNGNNGTVNGATLTNDRFGNTDNYYLFDGISNRIAFNLNSINNSLPASSESTSSIWIKTTDLNGPLISMQGNNGIEYDFHIGTLADVVQNPGYYGILVRDNCCGSGNNSFASNCIDNSWHMLSIIRLANGTLKFYKDGVLENTSGSGQNGALIFNPTFMSFGANYGWVIGSQNGCMSCNSNEQQHYNGKLDDIGIWNRALTQQEITNLYNGCSASTITIQPTNQTVNPTTSAQFIVNATSGSSFQWQTDLGLGFQNLSNAGQYSGANNDTLVVSNASTSNNNQQFRCIVNNAGCVDTSDIAVLTVSTVGMNELSVQGNVSLYPNPTQSSFEIQTNLVYSKIEIRDMQGRIVKTENAGKTITIASLQKGTYLVQLLDDKSKVLAVQQIIKE